MNERLDEFLAIIERLAGGETHLRIPVSSSRDQLDALAFGINAIAEELVFHKEAAEAANKAKTRFLANMSHEIRTPLSAVLGLCELLRDPLLTNSERVDTVQRIRANGDFLLGIVDDVLDLTKIESGKTELQLRWINPADVVEGVVRGLEHLANAKKIELKCVIGMAVPKKIKADPLRVRQILTNLVANSIKFTSNGSVKIELNCIDGARLEFRVTDTGIGIDVEKQQKLFQAFQQADVSISQDFGGTGLGLALGRRLAQLMDGSLTLSESALGVGSTFVFTLPVQLSEASTDAAPVSHALPPARLRGVRVLLAEDSPELRFLYRSFLEREGAKVEVAADGEEAIACAESQNFDMVLMDVNMPRLGGIEATRRLRKNGCGLPIVALTAHALGIHEAECRAAGYSGSLSKPFYPDTLTETVRRALGRDQ